jgi:hypothetical protein
MPESIVNGLATYAPLALVAPSEFSIASMGAMESPSEDQLADRSGTTADRIERLVGLGMLVPAADGSFAMSDINVARLAEAMDREGVSLADMGAAAASGHDRSQAE